MLTTRKPSLRHFAVIERVDRSRFGSTWLVQDRRNPLRKQYLFVPSRLRSWPIWLSRLELLEPTPTRLRNGRVAILISAADANFVREAFRKPPLDTGTKLNALTGFEAGPRRSKVRLAFLPALSLCLCLLLVVPKEQSVATQKVESPKPEVSISCAKQIANGSQAFGSVKQFGFLDIGSARYKIASLHKLGGLTQVKVKRVCDKKYLKLDLWSEGAQLKVEKVY